MKVLIATDSFKGSLTSVEVGQIIKQSWLQEFSDHQITVVPIADGGEGTLEAFAYIDKARQIDLKVFDPLGRETKASYLQSGKRAIIESAQASGLHLVGPEERSPLTATSYGTGQLIKHALDQGATEVVIGLGGSATNDLGVGLLEAMGVRFIGPLGVVTHLKPKDFKLVDAIDTQLLHPAIKHGHAKITIMCDVDNPLLGPRGATRVYGPQKGVTESMQALLESNLTHVAGLIDDHYGGAVSTLAGAGAAGGMAAALVGCLNGALKSGITTMLDHLDIAKDLPDYDLIITGEGCVDHQTLHGKVPQGIATLAKHYNKPVLVIGGAVTEAANHLYDHGVMGIASTMMGPLKASDLVPTAELRLNLAVKHTCRMLKLGQALKRSHV